MEGFNPFLFITIFSVEGNHLKNSQMKKLFLLGLITLFLSCEKDIHEIAPCSPCNTSFIVNTTQHPNTTFDGEYWHLEFSGLEYFQIIGNISEVDSRYVINGVPLVRTEFDSDTWYVFDTLAFRLPLFSPFSSQYTSPTWNHPIPSGDTVIYITNNSEIVNAVGYSFGHPNFVNTIGTYTPRVEVLVFKEMVGDTIDVYTRTTFNYDLGPREVVLDTVKVIIE